MKLFVKTLGELELTGTWDDQILKLPSSKRTRALLAYLAMTGRPHRRERLCEVFWKLPDDPRGALRWSLSKIRGLVNYGDVERLVADRERVSLLMDDIEIDVRSLALQIDMPTISTTRLKEISLQLKEPFLDGLDLADQELYQQWLSSERLAVKKLRIKVLSLLAQHPSLDQVEQLHWARSWEALDSYNPLAANRLLVSLDNLGLEQERLNLSERFAERFMKAGIPWDGANDSDNEPVAAPSPAHKSARDLSPRQRIKFCTAADGVQLAHMSVGQGTPVVKAGSWMSSLAKDWDTPTWSPIYRALEEQHQFIRYDQRGCGLSDRQPGPFQYEDWVTDLETVVDANNLDRFALFGMSQGAAIAVDYAARHPERVSHLVLFGAFPVGWRHGKKGAINTARETRAMIEMGMVGWEKDDPAILRLLSVLFMPTADVSEILWFTNYLRETTSREIARRSLYLIGDVDVTEQLAKVQAPTLVAHSLGDKTIPVSAGRDIVTAVPNAEFCALESQNHILLGREPATQDFIDMFLDFINR
ncbi:alpha/beta fold hydrolase [Saccharospirillum sp. HFRX-1]|uniref:alpha/beta fold hydrolase n=1 Tax=unclassified Saccharospirillum TaxID=2633430 RepID=UPI0037118C56